LTANARLRSASLIPELDLGTLVLNFEQGMAAAPHKSGKLSAPVASGLNLLPARIALGAPTPALVTGHADRHQYDLTIKGEADVARLRAVVAALGLPTSSLQGTQRAHVDLLFQGAWAGFQAPQLAGTVKSELPMTPARQR